MTQENKKKSPIRIVLTVIEAIIVVVLVAFSIYTIVNNRKELDDKNLNFVFGKAWVPVLTDSMKGDNPDSFSSGDLVIDRKYKEGENLEIGTIITYYDLIDGQWRFNTHRIISINYNDDGSVQSYQTKGDHNLGPDTSVVNLSNIKGIYVKHYVGAGKPFIWMQKPNNFLLVILVPLIALVLVNVIDLVRMIMKYNAKKLKEQYAAAAPKETEEEMRARILAELMAQQNQNAQPAEPAVEEKTAENTGTAFDDQTDKPQE